MDPSASPSRKYVTAKIQNFQIFFPQVWIFFFLFDVAFSHPAALKKYVQIQLSHRKPLSLSCSLALCLAGHCPLPLPVIVNARLRRDSQLPGFPFFSLPAAVAPERVGMERELRRAVEERRTGKRRGKKRGGGRDAGRERICQNSSKTLGEAEEAASSCSRSRWSEEG